MEGFGCRCGCGDLIGGAGVKVNLRRFGDDADKGSVCLFVYLEGSKGASGTASREGKSRERVDSEAILKGDGENWPLV